MQNSNREYKRNYLDTNECTSRGACSVSPSIASMEEVAILFLQQLAYYILKLENFGASNNKIRFEIITTLASLISLNEFSEKQLHTIIVNEYFMLEEVKKTYNQLCKEKNIVPQDIKRISKFNASTTVAQTIALGEKLFLEKYNKISTEQKNLIEILMIIIKSVSLNLIKLNDFNEFDSEIYHEILKTLDIFNDKKLQNKQVMENISKLAMLDYKLQLKISELLLKTCDGISKVEVSHSTTKGKAILVSGNNFFDLLKILEETKDKDIDIYTHSNLLITHALNKFHQFKNLKGHYGDNTENCILDFATFPGSILLTKNSKNNTEYLYRGRLFSNDYIVPNGVIKIENDNYDELIEAAENAKGFSKGKTKENTILGFNEQEIETQIDTIIEKLNNGNIEKLYIIGIDPHSQIQKEYFKEFLTKLKPKEFAISFSYESKKDNVLTINIGNYIPLASAILKKLFDKYPLSSNKIVFLFTTCDVMTISNIIILKNKDAKNIHMAKCQPTIINPSVFETFSNTYSIKTTTNPENDLNLIRKQKDTP